MNVYGTSYLKILIIKDVIKGIQTDNKTFLREERDLFLLEVGIRFKLSII